MSSALITAQELESIRGLPHLSIVLYLALRARMDYATGLVGHVWPRISWYALGEQLAVDPTPGMRAWRPSIGQLRRAAGWLIRRGLIEPRGSRNDLTLVFLMKAARSDLNAPKKADRKPTGKPTDSGNARAIGKTPKLSTVSRQTPPAKADKHPVSGKPTNEQQQQNIYPTEEQSPPGSTAGRRPAATPTIYPRGLSSSQIEQISRTINGNPARQKVLDELAGIMQTKSVKSPLALLTTLLRQVEQNAFIPSHADRVQAERELDQAQAELKRATHDDPR